MQKMVQLPVRIEKELIKSIDRIVEMNPKYRSRSEFIRIKLHEDIEEEDRKLIDNLALEIKEKLIKRGVTPKLLTHADKKRIADEFLKEKGLNY